MIQPTQSESQMPLSDSLAFWIAIVNDTIGPIGRQQSVHDSSRPQRGDLALARHGHRHAPGPAGFGSTRVTLGMASMFTVFSYVSWFAQKASIFSNWLNRSPHNLAISKLYNSTEIRPTKTYRRRKRWRSNTRFDRIGHCALFDAQAPLPNSGADCSTSPGTSLASSLGPSPCPNRYRRMFVSPLLYTVSPY